MAQIVSGTLRSEKTAKAIASRRVALAEKAAKWPVEVATTGKGTMEGHRTLILSDGKQFRIDWRSLKGVGFWLTAAGRPVYFGKTLTEATLRLAEAAEHPQ